ncbi:uncharacterized protein CMC5_032560 [Chondromyces crocatus]|uniref:Alpha-2-macroglobulin n=2 Tax=Chondromyces crocatus TaxID=52 RepID=A0A0K1EE39_CHOCO|nr:uncharacterized protein CMC5_032560 [Chondromyces crocatus]
MSGGASSGESASPLLVREVSVPEGELVFPPPSAQRVVRDPLEGVLGVAVPRHARAEVVAESPEVTLPMLDQNRKFVSVGQSFRIRFDQDMELPPKVGGWERKGLLAAKGTLRLTPEVKGEARWINAFTLEFTAAGQFAGDQDYEVALGALKGKSGQALAPWSARLRVTPSVTLAGKVLGYVPDPETIRSVAVYPSGETIIARSQGMSVLYDQPIALTEARKVISLVGEDERPIPLVFDRPRGRTFQGVEVDPRLVVLARPAAPLRAGQKVTLRVRDGGTVGGVKTAAETRTMSVAEPLALKSPMCGSRWDEEACVAEDGQLWVDTQGIHLQFNHAIALSERALRGLISVTPPVRNLSIQNVSWMNMVSIGGGFEASRSYRIVVSGLVDDYGGRIAQPIQLAVRRRPLGASATLPEGLLVLDPAMSKQFPLTTRNVLEAELWAWPIASGDAEAFEAARTQARTHKVPDGAPPVRVPVSIKEAKADALVTSVVDLQKALPAGGSFLTTVRATKFAPGAEPMKFPRGSEAERPSVALLQPAREGSLAVHARSLDGSTLVHVSRLLGGEPVAQASVRFEGKEGPAVTTDAQGIALLGAGSGQVRVEKDGVISFLSLDEGGVSAKHLFPEMAGGNAGSRDDDEEGEGEGDAAVSSAERALLLTDRGIYRPGATVWLKGSLRRPEGDRLVPVAGSEVELRVVGPTGEEVHRARHTTNELGSVATRVDLPADSKVGPHQVLLGAAGAGGESAPLASTMVQVAEFEAPRFAVDVDAAETPVGLRATVRGRYLFGAAMDGGRVSWTLKREAAAFPDGPLTEAGLVFRRSRSWWEDRDGEARWSRAGDGTLGPDGTVVVEQALSMAGVEGPQAFVLEADVTDSSNRHIANRSRVVKHPVARYAGLRLPSSWVGVGEAIPVELGVSDTSGRPVVGASVSARMTRVSWAYTQQRGPGGALRWRWTRSLSEAGRCEVKSAAAPVRCTLTAPHSGDYEIHAEVDGRKGGRTSIWAWRDGSREQVSFPDRGRTVQVATDKARYAPGETAKILVRSPYKAATAVLTVEQGRLLSHRSQRVEGSSAVFEVPIDAAHAPHAHVAVTLLPVGETGSAAVDYKVGAVRIPVSLAASRLDLAVKSDRASFEPGEEVGISLELKERGAPVEGAEIALAVVDEGILRLTNFHLPDPVTALRPGMPLRFHLRDSREGLAELYERSHVAGDGGGSERTMVSQTRKDFVETALWRPDLRTDAEGRASVRFKLPDNLTRFRMMAVALDRGGKGAMAESDFTVRKPLMLVPVVPRFAARGDRFELSAMVHNNTEAPVAATVRLGEKTAPVTVPAGGHSRVAFPFEAREGGEQALSFAVADGTGKVRDAVDLKLRVDEPGLTERPHLDGAFQASREIALAVPASVDGRGGALRVRVGQNLWPELGPRVAFLLGYPHGCVEQTTSSTLPLIAARTILPRIGVAKLSDAEIATRIKAGLTRLSLMKTMSGGLGYWPGDREPNVYGTAYAMRAVVLAKAAGIEAPPGLLEGMQRYLGERLLDGDLEPEVRAAIAESLAELRALPESAADALYDTRERQSLFGKASLAMALSSLSGQEDRVATLLDAVEDGLDADGKLASAPKTNDFHYYGSPTRSRAQAAMALTRLRRGAPVLPRLLSALVRETEAYTTQATSFALLAVAGQIAATTVEGSPVQVFLDGEALAVDRDLGFGSKEFAIPIEKVKGRRATLRLTAEGPAAVAYQVEAAWRRPLFEEGSEALVATRAALGPSVHRVYTDPQGKPIELGAVRAGDLVRVALLVGVPSGLSHERRGYLAITDRLPGGFEPVQPDLATVASAPELDGEHPLSGVLRYGSEASHVELRDDRVLVYFDKLWGERVAATYLARATTAGSFVVPPAAAEFMYEGDSTGYSEAERVVIR